MAGTKEGGIKTAKTIKTKYGSDYYKTIGSKGGKLGTTGGFYADRELASRAGKKGGKKSKRGPSKKPAKTTKTTYREHVTNHTTIDDVMEQSKPSIFKKFLRRV